MLVVGDIGFGVVTKFALDYPKQFVNAGVAEQNMTGLSAGLALSGKTVFTYSIANFPVIRCLEQIRNDVCYHNANVKVVAVGGGMAYGSLGISHHATEDIAIMRTMPNMVVLAPGDPFEARRATQIAWEHPGPCYLRIGRAGEPNVHAHALDFRLGEALVVRTGRDAALFSTGGGLADVVAAANALSSMRIECAVVSFPTIKPLDRGAVLHYARETGAVFCIEEHSIVGGLGGAVAEVLAEGSLGPVIFHRIGIPDQLSSIVGDQEFLRTQYHLDPANIVKRVQTALAERTQQRV